MTEQVSDVSKQRLPWVDTGRGIAILLVPIYHATNWLLGTGLNVAYWTQINDVLATLRMPLFFTLAGLFAPKWLSVDWGTLLRSKLLLFAWVFVVWEVIGSFVFLLGQAALGKGVNLLGSAEALLISPVLPRFELWFIWALMLFFVAAKATRRLDPRAQLVLAGVIALMGLTLWSTTTTGWTGSAKYYFFFLAGMYLREPIMWFGRIRSRLLMSTVFGLWAVVSMVAVRFEARDVVGVYFIDCVLGVLAGIVLSRALVSVRVLGRIGQQTLPIYLAHTPIIIILSFAIGKFLLDPANAVAPVVPLLVAWSAIYLALVLYHFARTRRLRILYEPPDTIKRWTSKMTKQ